jgi:putative ABC transport system permease protein
MSTRADLVLAWRLFVAEAEHNRRRMGLTILSVAWGTLAMVMLLSFGEGLERAFHRNKRGIGDGIGVLWPGSTTRPYRGLPAGRTITFADEDADLLQARVAELGAVSREYAVRRGLTVGGKTVNARIRGVDPVFGTLRNQVPQPGGRFLDELDLVNRRRVVFLGDELARGLFGGRDPVGQTVLLERASFLVVGVMEPKVMMGMYAGPDKGQAAIPVTTFKAVFSRAKMGYLVYRPVRVELAEQARRAVYRVLADKYHFDPEDRRALGLLNTAREQRLLDDVALGIQLFLGLVGGLTLFVGGTGVANVMYAIVRERSAEIGLKMALGARVCHLMASFMVEALLITLLGGLAGTTTALALIGLITVLPLEGEAFAYIGRPTFSPLVALATVTFLGTIGALSGYFPARRAASLDPAQSLRQP